MGTSRDIYQFLLSVPPKELPLLEDLQLLFTVTQQTQQTQQTLPGHVAQNVVGLSIPDLLGELVRGLVKLKNFHINRYDGTILLGEIMKKGGNLRALHLENFQRDYVSLVQLKSLRDACFNLTKLGIGVPNDIHEVSEKHLGADCVPGKHEI